MTSDAVERWLARADIERLRQVLEDREDALLLLTRPDGTLLWASAVGSLSMFGRVPAEYLGHRGQRYVHAEDQDRVTQALADSAGSGATAELDYRAIAADGSTIRVRTVAWGVTSNGGDPVVVSVTVPQSTRRPLVV